MTGESTMQVAISGASGTIGRALADSLRRDGHRVRPLVRDRDRAAADRDAIFWEPAAGVLEPTDLRGVDAAVHLAGHPIGRWLWTARERAKLWDSRVASGRLLAEAIASLDDGPSVLLSGSAIGIYGHRGDEELTEDSAPGTGFLADLVVAWEAAADPARAAGVRVAHPRTGLVLARGEGILRKLTIPFRFYLGGRYGDGRQWMSWISLDDEVRALRHLLEHDIAGAVNLVGPNPVTNAELMQELGAAMGRPAAVPIPALAFKLLGEFGRSLGLDSQRVLPAVLQRSGFQFHHDRVQDALAVTVG